MSISKNNKKVIIAGVVFIAILAILAIVYTLNKPKTTEGKKHIEVLVTYADKSTKTFDITTEEKMLGPALKDEKLVDGSESETGIFITTVDGYTVDNSKEEWWMISKDGESLTTGVDSTPIKDGDHFEITLTVGY